jgi:hypothetical protein
MKIPNQLGFWPLRPTLTARGFESGCWLAGGILAVALVLSPARPSGPLAQPVRTVVVPQTPELLAYRRRCIDSVLAGDLGETEEYVVRQINQRCSTRRRMPELAPVAARPRGPACGRLLVASLTPVARRVAGCPAGGPGT